MILVTNEGYASMNYVHHHFIFSLQVSLKRLFLSSVLVNYSSDPELADKNVSTTLKKVMEK